MSIVDESAIAKSEEIFRIGNLGSVLPRMAGLRVGVQHDHDVVPLAILAGHAIVAGVAIPSLRPRSDLLAARFDVECERNVTSCIPLRASEIVDGPARDIVR